MIKTFLTLLLLAGCHTNSMQRATATITKSSGETLTVKVEVARSEEERARGLMHRKRLPEGEGMMFIFPEETQASFWMKNTPIPLDLIFIKDNQIVALIERAIPFSEDLLAAPAAYDRVLEVPAGYVSRHEIAIGMPVFSP